MLRAFDRLAAVLIVPMGGPSSVHLQLFLLLSVLLSALTSTLPLISVAWYAFECAVLPKLPDTSEHPSNSRSSVNQWLTLRSSTNLTLMSAAAFSVASRLSHGIVGGLRRVIIGCVCWKRESVTGCRFVNVTLPSSNQRQQLNNELLSCNNELQQPMSL